MCYNKRWKFVYFRVFKQFRNVIIPLTHHKNSGYTELKVLGVYFSPPQAGEKYGALNYLFVYRIFNWVLKG